MPDFRQLYYSNSVCRAAMRPAVMLRRKYLDWKLDAARLACSRLAEIALEDLVVDVEEFEGRFRIGASSHLLQRLLVHGYYEPELAGWAKSHVDSTRDVVDVGANIGFFTVLLARQLGGGRVLAIEPSSSALCRLKWNIEANGLVDRVIVFEGLAARENGMGQLKVFDGMEEYASAGVADHVSIRELSPKFEQTRKMTIDALVAENGLQPGFIKIDVEGFEMEVLSGASRTLQQYRPLILSELSDSLLKKNGSSAEEVVDLLRKHRYRVADPLYEKVSPGQRDHADLVAFPLPA